MPKNRGSRVARKNIRIPESLIDEVDRIVRTNGLYVNRQQFVESAIREKVERTNLLVAPGPAFLGFGSEAARLVRKADDGFLVRVRETFLVHTVVGLVRGEMPVHHSDPRKFEEKVRAYIVRRAEIEGRKLTERQVGELTDNLLEYYREILKGLNVLSPVDLRGR